MYSASIEEMVKAAKERGLEYIAITDHASPMGMVKGIKDTHRSLEEYLKKIEHARKKFSGIHILAGSEVDILRDGGLYLPDELLQQLDFVIASIHQNFHDSREQNTARLIRACENPDVHLRRAKELGVKIVMGSDAHSTKGFDYRFGILQARRGWLEKGDVVNTLPFTEFFKIVG